MIEDYDKNLKELYNSWKMIQRKPLLENRILSGEYWIIKGEAVFADVDVNDMSHEAYVIQHLARDFLNYFDIDNNDEYAQTLNNFETEILNYFVETGIIEDENQKEEYNNDPANFILN
jgi:hypothetical protein